jgi:hypothetical protein
LGEGSGCDWRSTEARVGDFGVDVYWTLWVGLYPESASQGQVGRDAVLGDVEASAVSVWVVWRDFKLGFFCVGVDVSRCHVVLHWYHPLGVGD